jgi:hypothetical protein
MNVKDVIFCLRAGDRVLVIDRDDYGATSRDLSLLADRRDRGVGDRVDRGVVTRALGDAKAREIVRVHVYGKWSSWTVRSGRGIQLPGLTPMSSLEAVDFPPIRPESTDTESFVDSWMLISFDDRRGHARFETRPFVGLFNIVEICLSDGMKEIGPLAFAKCLSLKTAKLGTGLVALGNDAFCGCLNLEEIVLPDEVMEIGERSFQGCTSLKTVRVGTRLVEVKSRAFESCSSLVEISLADTVVEIGESAFGFCSMLEKVKLGGSV